MNMLSKDPYRLLFPIALLNFILGVGVWLPHFFGDASSFPLIEHMQLLMRGTMYCFIIGFLLTMLPRVWGASFISLKELSIYAIGFLSFPLLIFFNQVAVFEYVVIGLLLLFAYDCLYRMFPRGRSPSKFVYAICTAVVIVVLANIGFGLSRIGVAVPSTLGNWSQLVAMQGGILLFIFVLVPFLVKKFQGGGPCCELQKNKRSNFLPSIIITIFAASYFITGDWEVLGRVVRTALLAVAFCEALPLWRWPGQSPWFIKGIWMSLWCIILGHGIPIFEGNHVIVWNHLMYITGFLQLCLMVGARVVCGHAQQMEQLERNHKPIIGIIVLLVISVLSRVGVDWAPETRALHLVLAAVFALIALGLWFVCYGRYLYTEEAKHA